MRNSILTYWFACTLICTTLIGKKHDSFKDQLITLGVSAIVGWIVVPMEIGMVLNDYHYKNIDTNDKH